jgi:CheY-like chemotaxis protein
MKDTIRVLILEDEPLISLLLQDIVEDATPAIVIVKESIAEAERVLNDPFDLALLDIDLTNGKSYDIAQTLSSRDVPFVFVSATNRAQLPASLRDAPFISKPFEATRSRKSSSRRKIENRFNKIGALDSSQCSRLNCPNANACLFRDGWRSPLPDLRGCPKLKACGGVRAALQ